MARKITKTSVLGLWHPSPFRAQDGRSFHHVEGWLQARKHERNPDFAREIARSRSASQARAMGDERLLWADLDLGKRALTDDDVADWHARRSGVLRAGLLAQIRQNHAVRHELLSTGDAHLEYEDDSAFYAAPGNEVGLQLMQIRDELRTSPFVDDDPPPPSSPPPPKPVSRPPLPSRRHHHHHHHHHQQCPPQRHRTKSPW
jgi:predicted NAD-dependent protein-ADP-ribosyltransferase YbiA (DUF1768 family)